MALPDFIDHSTRKDARGVALFGSAATSEKSACGNEDLVVDQADHDRTVGPDDIASGLQSLVPSGRPAVRP